MKKLILTICIFLIGGFKVITQPDWSKGQTEWNDPVKEAPKFTSSYNLFCC